LVIIEINTMQGKSAGSAFREPVAGVNRWQENVKSTPKVAGDEPSRARLVTAY
jgi:hypothetical protein